MSQHLPDEENYRR